MLSVFRSKPKFATVRPKAAKSINGKSRDLSDNLWTRCENCSALIYNKELSKNMYVCHKCGFHFRISAVQRLKYVVDEDSFRSVKPLVSKNPLNFPEYPEKIVQCQADTKLDDAILIGEARINGNAAVVGIIDFSFIGGSMGSVVGEQITRGFERGVVRNLPVIIISGGGGGARMQEGIFSLMQMAKTAQAVGKFRQSGLLYISVLTHPTMGGIYASFASLGDIILAEPQALIGFAGPRIVSETTRQKLPKDFQTSEYALQNGMIDTIVTRVEMKDLLGKLLSFHL
ncbi:MAG: acetyl-CoA carboxylase carboxyltransferase subunit beta [Firmicutes bacterium]|nr:acetyl-CoA carboxylase carboxyltransferase subunit beta [Bacillota bacterium]